jgi:hypothetical protein
MVGGCAVRPEVCSYAGANACGRDALEAPAVARPWTVNPAAAKQGNSCRQAAATWGWPGTGRAVGIELAQPLAMG